MTQFRYVSHGGKRYDQLDAPERAAQLQYLLTKTRAALDYILAQVRDAKTIRPDGTPVFADASFTFSLPGAEVVYADVSVAQQIGNNLTVNVSARQLQTADVPGIFEQTFSSVIKHHPQEFRELFESYPHDTFKVCEDGTDSYIAFII